MANRLIQGQDWLHAYMEYQEDTEAPRAFHLWTGISMIASVLKSKCYVDHEIFCIYPNFYIALHAPPALTKSTAISGGRELLSQLPGRVKFGPDSMTWATLIQELEAAKEAYVDDTGTRQEMCPLSFYSSELQSLIHLDDRDMLVTLTDLYDGKSTGSWNRRTKTSGSNSIVNPYVNILGGVTPDGFSELDKRKLLGGFASRLLIVEAHKKHAWIAFPEDQLKNNRATRQRLEAELKHDLEEIAAITGRFTFEPAAKKFIEPWYAANQKLVEDTESEEEQNLEGRQYAHLQKLGMVLSAARGDDKRITEADVRNADKILGNLKPGAKKVIFAAVTSNGQQKTMKIWDIIQKHKKLKRQALYRKFEGQLTGKEFTEALESLQDLGYIKVVTDIQGTTIEALKVSGGPP